KDMTAALLQTRGPVLKTEANLNNQYGLPLMLLRLRPEHSAAVLELGMSAPGELRALAAIARPDVAVITMVAPVHLEFFDSVDAIAAAKAEILEGLAEGGAAVLNGDDPRVRVGGGPRAGDPSLDHRPYRHHPEGGQPPRRGPVPRPGHHAPRRLLQLEPRRGGGRGHGPGPGRARPARGLPRRHAGAGTHRPRAS